MSGGRERIAPDVVKAVEEAARLRIEAPSDKELQQRFKISRASIFRIIQAAKKRWRVESMKQ